MGRTRDDGGYYWQMLVGGLRGNTTSTWNAPVADLSPTNKWTSSCTAQEAKRSPCTTLARAARSPPSTLSTRASIPNLERRYKETSSDYLARPHHGIHEQRPCPACKGARLRPEALAVTDRRYTTSSTVTDWPVRRYPQMGRHAWRAARFSAQPAPEDHRQPHPERTQRTLAVHGRCRPGISDPATARPRPSPAAKPSASAWPPRSARA